MTRDMITALSAAELEQAGLWVAEETRVRAEQERQDTIARIKKLAADKGLSVTINGARGRPKKVKEPSRKAAAQGGEAP